MMAVGFIGTGHIAAPMARALARTGHSVCVSERNSEVAASLAGAGLGISVGANQQVIDASDVVFLCLRPSVWRDVLAGLTWRADQQIVSVMAGPTLAEIAQVCAPVTQVGATIPYGFIEAGGCPLPVVGDAAALQALFGEDNPVLPQTEEGALTAYFAASALVSGVLEMLEVASGWLGAQTGDADAAEVYVGNLISGVLANLPKDAAGQLGAEKAALATPGTLNLQMIEGLRAAGSFDALPGTLGSIKIGLEGTK